MKALVVPAICILLAACGGGDDEDDQRTARGQVLEGSISDSMLPLETVRSQPPLAQISGTPNASATQASAPEQDATATPEEDATPTAAASGASGDGGD